MKTAQIRENTRNGFSLIELLLVIFIISLVYFLGFSTVQKEKKHPTILSPQTLKSAILHSSIFQGEGTLICTGKCQQCYFRKDISSPFKAYEGKIDMEDLKVYTLNANSMLTHEEIGRYQDEKICLRIHFYPNGSSTPLVVENSKGIYFLPAYFGDPQKVTSLEEAKELWIKQHEELKQAGAIY